MSFSQTTQPTTAQTGGFSAGQVAAAAAPLAAQLPSPMATAAQTGAATGPGAARVMSHWVEGGRQTGAAFALEGGLPAADPAFIPRDRSPETTDRPELLAHGKQEVKQVMDAGAVPRETQALWMAELQTEQTVPSMTANGGPGQPTGRDASKDFSQDGSINVGPWNDNVAMLSKYGGLELPLKKGGTGRWDQGGVTGEAVDWDAVRARYTGQSGADNIQPIIAAKTKAMDALGLDGYMAGRRGGLGVLNDDGHGKITVDRSSKYDGSGREYWSGQKFDAWKAGHLEMAAEHLAHPEYMTDDRRRAFNYEHI